MAFYQNVEIDWATWKAMKAGNFAAATAYYLQNDLQYVPFFVDSTNSFVYYVNVNRDPSQVKGPYAALSAGAKASVHLQSITWTAVNYGTAGNSITIQYVSDATAVGKEYVTVSGNAVTVHIVSGASTAQQVLSAVNGWSAYNSLINRSAVSSYLIQGVIDAGKSGTPQTTAGSTPLTGGVATVTVLADWETNFLSTSTRIGSFSDGIGAEVA